MTMISAQIPENLYKTLQTISKRLDLSSSQIVRKALSIYLQELQEDIEDYNDALKALKDNDSGIPWEEVKRKNGLEG